MPACDLPYRITNERSLKSHWPTLVDGLRARTVRPRSLGSRERPWNPKLRDCGLINTCTGLRLARSHRAADGTILEEFEFRKAARKIGGKVEMLQKPIRAVLVSSSFTLASVGGKSPCGAIPECRIPSAATS